MLKITFIGHATFLIEMEDEFILTDPLFSKKVLGFPRHQEPGIKPEALPPLNSILVSHAHYDHLDLFSYKYFSLHTPVMVPLGLGKLLTKFLKNPIVEIPPWSQYAMGEMTIHAVPVKHTGFRLSGLTWKNTTGFILEKNGIKIFFAGDTADGDHFRKIAELHKIDVALLPIGNYEPRWLMKHRHMNPEEAVQAFLDLKAEVMIPYHWGAFRLSQESLEEPGLELKRILKERPGLKVKILKPGESFSGI